MVKHITPSPPPFGLDYEDIFLNRGALFLVIKDNINRSPKNIKFQPRL